MKINARKLISTSRQDSLFCPRSLFDVGRSVYSFSLTNDWFDFKLFFMMNLLLFNQNTSCEKVILWHHLFYRYGLETNLMATLMLVTDVGDEM